MLKKTCCIQRGATLQVNQFMALGFQDCPKFKKAQNSTLPLGKEEKADKPMPVSKSNAKATCTDSKAKAKAKTARGRGRK